MEDHDDDLTGDVIIDEIRAARWKISAQFDHDPVKLCEHYMRLQEQHPERMYVRPTELKAEADEGKG